MSTRLNSSHSQIYTLSLHDALPILLTPMITGKKRLPGATAAPRMMHPILALIVFALAALRSDEHTSELQSQSNLHSFPTRRSSDLAYADDHRQEAVARSDRHAADDASDPGVDRVRAGGT